MRTEEKKTEAEEMRGEGQEGVWSLEQEEEKVLMTGERVPGEEEDADTRCQPCLPTDDNGSHRSSSGPLRSADDQDCEREPEQAVKPVTGKDPQVSFPPRAI